MSTFSPLRFCTCLAAALLLPLSAHADTLLAYFAFEDNYDDSSGNNTVGSEGENPAQLSFVAGFRGQSLDINDPDTLGNSGGRFDIAIDANPASLPEVTFGGWVNVEGTEFDGFMAMDNGGWDRGIAVNSGGDAFGVVSGAAPTLGAAINRGSWQYVVATFSQTSGQAILYVGDDVASTNSTTVATGSDLAGLGETIIEVGRYDNQDLDGVVDDLFVFDGALSAAKVNAIRNLRLSGLDYTPAEAAALFDLFDASSNGTVKGNDWAPKSGLTAAPGALEDLGAQGTGVVLDDQGNGMSAITGLVFDFDNDGLPDSWEILHFGDLSKDGTGDEDMDGLTEQEEFDEGTDPNDNDSDDDGLTDGAEVATHQTDPLDADSDNDGFSDFDEVNANPPTNPNDENSFPPPAPATLLAYFPFEGDYVDATGNGNDATPSQNPDQLTFVQGFRGQSVDINDPDATNNTGGSIDIPIDGNPPSHLGVSFGGWVNVEANEFDGFMAMDNGGWDRGSTVSNDTASPGFGIASGAAPVMLGEITHGSWQYVVGSFEPTSGTVLYVGDADPGTPTTLTAMGSDATFAPFGLPVIEIGRYDNQDLDGIVDDVFVFDSVLTSHEANAIRNLRLSALDLSPLDAAAIFELFRAGASGAAGGVGWSPVSGLDPTNPGEVFASGGNVSVVLDDDGNGMRASSRIRMGITREADGSLTIDWDSKDGKLYNLRSEANPAADVPTNWPIFGGHEDIAATPPLNTLNIPLPVDDLRLFIIEEFSPPPVVLYTENFDANDGGWTGGVDDPNGFTIWGHGAPQITGPAAANSAPNCWGTNIDDNYETDAMIWLRSGPIDLSGVAEATLRYFEYKDIEDPAGADHFDFGTISVLNASDDSVLAELKTNIDGLNANWRQVTLLLPAAAVGQEIKLEFRFQSDFIQNQPGWYIDDIEITTP
jgi:hypothetical protein